MPQPTRDNPQKTDTPHRQYPGYNGSAEQAQEFIDEYGPKEDPAEGARDLKSLNPSSSEPDIQRKRADVPVGPSEHDKLVPPEVAQGD